MILQYLLGQLGNQKSNAAVSIRLVKDRNKLENAIFPFHMCFHCMVNVVMSFYVSCLVPSYRRKLCEAIIFGQKLLFSNYFYNRLHGLSQVSSS